MDKVQRSGEKRTRYLGTTAKGQVGAVTAPPRIQPSNRDNREEANGGHHPTPDLMPLLVGSLGEKDGCITQENWGFKRFETLDVLTIIISHAASSFLAVSWLWVPASRDGLSKLDEAGFFPKGKLSW